MPRTTATPEERRRGRLLGQRLARERSDRQWSQARLAGDVGITVDGLRKIEQGKVAHPSFFTVARLLRRLGISNGRVLNELVQ